jgi:hypothetical protein
MKKCLMLSVLCVLLAVVWGGYLPAQAQSSDLKPTFLAPTPGLYVNGWPTFTVSYPKDWVIQPNMPGEVFRASVPGPAFPPPLPALTVSAQGNVGDISGSANRLMQLWAMMNFREVKLLSDKATKLQDGTPAQEAELEFIPSIPGGTKRHLFLLTAKKDGSWIWISVIDDKGMISDELKGIAYSLKVAPGTREAVKLPPDVQAFLDKFNGDMDSHDIAKIMSNYSDGFDLSMMNKAVIQGWLQNSPESPLQRGISSASVTVTIFEPRGDKAYLAGFMGGNFKTGPSGVTPPINDNQIIKENGQWKWYGNRK